MRLMDKALRELAAGLRSKQFSALDLWREARAAMDAGEPRWGAYKLRADDLAGRQARDADAAFAVGIDHGLLQGIPVSVKDLYGVPGLPIYAGSARELPAKWQAAGPLVECLLDEKAVIAGKTHTVEFAFGGVGLNNHWPTPRNPWDDKHHRVPGGSSSGAGVSLREGSAIVALGSDTAGSVRLPASLTGNAGYKPTIDRWSTRGIVPLSRIFDTPGVLARTVDDAFLAAAEFDRRMYGDRPGAIGRAAQAERLRIGVPKEHFWDDCDPGIAEVVRAVLARFERAGHRLVPMSFPEAVGAYEQFLAGGTAGVELRAFLEAELPEWIPILDPNVGKRIEASAGIAAVEFLRRKEALEKLAAQALDRFRDVDVIATPTAICAPPRVDEVADYDRYRAANMRLLHNTPAANLLRLCAITMPVGLDALGLPVGLQLMAAGMRDDLLFSAALGFERVLRG
jgi:aspartyl-tRNA(Asn)/glutamyl-tRNA(Gln) amidotransferase subunit A